MSGLSLSLIREASAYLEGKVRHTPLEESPELSERLGVPVWLKLEFLQTTGSFKLRGAWFRLSRLTAGERQRGVATSSAGNHGQGLAHASRELGISATVYVPAGASDAACRRMRALGADVVRSSHRGYDDTEAWAREEARVAGKPFISPFDDDAVMAGNGGSLAAEILADLPDVKGFVVPVGGGGLGAGLSYYASETVADPWIAACQLAASPALQLSLERGEAVTRLPAVETAAGGLEGGIGRRTFEILRHRVTQVVLAGEDEILAAVRWLLDHHRYLVEPSAAVTVAACLSGKIANLAGPVAVILSGRNIDVGTARRALEPPSPGELPETTPGSSRDTG
ncbi:MAG: pyridoxal-phosphate dependent enzyme [Planctomycetota bacterium]|nr:pyridoxal-phosphate dependent enzyme [Planctomycetota bacterium]